MDRLIMITCKPIGKRVIQIGKTYRWPETGFIIFVTDFDLETFTGIVINQGKEKRKEYKLGKKANDFNADSSLWEEIKWNTLK